MPESKEREVENNNLPEMTDEQRKAALERSAEARRERMEFKELVKKGRFPLRTPSMMTAPSASASTSS